MSPAVPPTGWKASREPLARRYDVALLDLDGVVYVGPTAVPGAAVALAEARDIGMRVAFVTNNASRTPQVVAAHLCELGVPAAEAEVVTSAQAAARLVAERIPAGATVLLVGGDGLDAALRERGLRPVRQASDDVQAVVQGFAPTLGWADLAEAAYALARGVPWIASNLDTTFPTPRGLAPGNGALVAALQMVSGRHPTAVAGKPEVAMHRESVLRSGATRPLVVGDRLDTDIAGANRGGTDSLLVLTGVTDVEQLIWAEPEERPTYLSNGLEGLVGPHPDVVVTGEGASCGGWTVVLTADAVVAPEEPPPSGDWLDGIRALAAANWRGPFPQHRDALRRAAEQLAWQQDRQAETGLDRSVSGGVGEAE